MQPEDGQHDESDWGYSPYNVKNGGFLRTPVNFWTHPEAKRYYQQKVRYILARWAYSPNVLAREIFNEVDLARYYRSAAMGKIGAEWTGRMAQFIKENDPAKHIVTTNLFYLTASYWADPLWSRPEIDISTGHLFRGDLPEYLRTSFQKMSQYRKIFYVTECGDTPFGQGPQQTEAYLHLGIWASHAMPFAGVAMPWWWIFIDDRDLYHHFHALAKFAGGEDRRGKGIDFKSSQVVNLTTRQPFTRYRVESCGNRTWAVAWVYDLTHYGLISDETELAPEKTALVIPGFSPGTFKVELWDTYKGEIVETRHLRCTSGHLAITPLKVDKDVAIKVRRMGRQVVLPIRR